MLRQYEEARKEGMKRYGFGIGVMQNIKICKHCGEMHNVCESKCCECGAELPEKTLYEIYLQRHRHCAKCNVVVNKGVHYCPECGDRLKEEST